MSFITTNIRLPEDVYMDLKMQAARERTSISALIRQKITAPSHPQITPDKQEKIRKMHDFAERMAKKYKDTPNLTEGLIKMRYEQ